MKLLLILLLFSAVNGKGQMTISEVAHPPYLVELYVDNPKFFMEDSLVVSQKVKIVTHDRISIIGDGAMVKINTKGKIDMVGDTAIALKYALYTACSLLTEIRFLREELKKKK